MNLKRKKKFIARTLGVGVGRIKLDDEMREEIKEAITRQDIKGFVKEKIIKIKEKKGKKKKMKKKTRRREGSKKKRVGRRKQDYVKLTRKLRGYIKELKNKGSLSKKDYLKLRKRIKAKSFRSFAQFRQAVRGDLK